MKLTVLRAQMEDTYRDFPVYDIYQDRKGVVWFGLQDGEIIRTPIRDYGELSGSGWRVYGEDDGLAIGYSSRIVQTQDGLIWTVSGHGLKGVNRFDGKTWSVIELRTIGGDDHNYSILETEDGILWIGGNKGHLDALRNGTWQVYHPPEVSLSDIYVIDLLRGADGALWIAGEGQEVVRPNYDTPRWKTFNNLHFLV